MKFSFLTAMLLLAFQLSFSQTNYPTPDFDDKPMYFDKESGSLKKLERQTAQQKVKSGFLKASGYYYFDNSSSSFRVSGSEETTFIIKLAKPNIEIEAQLLLYKYEVDETKNQRILKIASGNISGSKSINSNIPYDYKKLDSGTFMISVEGLDPGEYGWATSTTTHLFGID